MARPVVTVGVPVHNGGALLEQALTSVLAADVDGLEVVVSDNASTDTTPELVQDLAAEDPRVRYAPTGRLLPVLHNFRRVFHIGQGTWFRWNGHDDWVEPGYLEASLAALRADPAAAATITDVVFVDDEQRPFLTHHEELDAASPDPVARLHAVLWRMRSHSTVAFSLARRDALAHAGLLRDIPESAKVLAAGLALAGPLPAVPGPRLVRTFADVHRRRDHWAWLDPRNAGRRRLATPRQLRHHLDVVARAPLSRPDRLRATADVIASLAVRRTREKAQAVWRDITGSPWEAPV